MRADWQKHTLKFKIPAGTSRGVLRVKESWLLRLRSNNGQTGIGECGMLKGLSWDDRPDYEDILDGLCKRINAGEPPPPETYRDWPSIRAGYEMAKLDLQNGGEQIYYPSDFTQGTHAIPINGLIWMGDKTQMLEQVENKIQAGFDCIKMKIGAIDFREEMEVLRFIRERYSGDKLVLRVDANGAFTSQNAMRYLEHLASLDIHSIEQPIPAGHWDEMANLVEKSPIPIALDEELIPLHDPTRQWEMLQTIRPHYIILKPSFTGGFAASESWIEMAESIGTGWWITSALESNIGLNAIAQWTATLPTKDFAQGLGTGSLYTNNFPSPLYIEKGALHYLRPDSSGNGF